ILSLSLHAALPISIKFFFGGILQFSNMRDACIIDKDIYPGTLACNFLKRTMHVLLVSDVAKIETARFSPPLDFLTNSLAGLSIVVQNTHVSARSRKHGGD